MDCDGVQTIGQIEFTLRMVMIVLSKAPYRNRLRVEYKHFFQVNFPEIIAPAGGAQRTRGGFHSRMWVRKITTAKLFSSFHLLGTF